MSDERPSRKKSPSEGPRRAGGSRQGAAGSGRPRSDRDGAPKARGSRADGARSDRAKSDGARSDGAKAGRARSGGAPKSGGGNRGGRDGDARQSRGRAPGGRDAGAPRRRPSERGVEEERQPRTVDQERYDGPPLPEEITGRELDRSVAAQLKSLPEKLGQRVARHLVAAGDLIDSDPRTAYEHTLAARARAGRLAVVREAVGEAAYAAGEYTEALAELRAARRMNGAQDYVAIMADCERALGRPDRALTLLKGARREKLAPALIAEMTIVEAGARRDRGEIDAALRTLEQAPLQSRSRDPWVARLRYAYAEALLEAGRSEDAIAWFHRTEAVDTLEATDAAERAAEIEQQRGEG